VAGVQLHAARLHVSIVDHDSAAEDPVTRQKGTVFLYDSSLHRGAFVGCLRVVRDSKRKAGQQHTGVFEIRMERLASSGYRYEVPLGYGVETRRDAASFEYGACSSRDYDVNVSHGVFKFPANALETCVVQSAGASVKRAFDVHLRCLNNPLRNCRFDELAPLDGRTIPRRMGP
jgi:hypothetical protein